MIPFTHSMPLSPGTRLGVYEVGSLLGAGGMGEVYRATDTRLKREVALKLLPDTFAADADRVARFEREAQVLASLNHPGIAAIYGLEESNATHALVMELVEGPTLAERLTRGALPLEEALLVARQIAEALDAAHEHGIIHRDLKPANIKVRDDGTVKVLDFGLAKFAGAGASGAMGGVAVGGAGAAISMSPTLTSPALLTGAGMLLGTAAYMAPEQARGREVDKRADIWAFGCVLFEMVAGVRPFGGEDLTDTLASIVKSTPDLDAAPPQVRRLLRKCLEKDPRRRLRDLGDAWDLLDDPAANRPGPDAGSGRRTRLPWAVAAVCAAIAAGLVAWQAAQPRTIAPVTRLNVQLPNGAVSTPLGSLTLSPDGRTLVFAAVGADGVQRLWRRTLDALEAVPLKGTEALNPPPAFWSPDGRYIAFWADGKLKKMNAAGGLVEIICDAPRVVLGGAWTADGTIIFGNGPGIMKVPAAGGTPVPITTPAAPSVDVYPSALPDGRHFLYLRRGGLVQPAVFVASVDLAANAQDTRKLLVTNAGVAYAADSTAEGHILFLRPATGGGPQSDLLAQRFDAASLTLVGEPQLLGQTTATAGFGRFAVSANDVLVYNPTTITSRLTWLDRQGRIVGTVGERGNYGTMKLSPDGTKVAVVEEDPATANQDIWILDLVRGGRTRFTFNPALDGQPTWSADGLTIAFRSNRGGKWGIYKKSVGSAGAEELVAEVPSMPSLTDWSRDGRYASYYLSSQGTGDDVWVLPMDGRAKPEAFPLVQTAALETVSYFSPDSKWLAFISDETGRTELYVQPFEPEAASRGVASRRVILSNGSSGMSRWRADGRELIFLGLDGRVMSAATTLTPTFHAEPAVPLFSAPLEFISQTTTPGARADAAADNQRFLMQLPDRSGSESLAVILNWSASLSR